MVKRHAHWTTSAAGGKGAAREICEFMLEARGVLEEQLNGYLQP
jgi:3-deoxy-D-manno-octulosonate 8-phosphate phosphatase (KDO 8-P phosphatase)